METFSGMFLCSCVHRVCFLRKSTEFHCMRMECQRKSILVHFLLYLFSFTPRSLAPKVSCSPITHSPIACSLISRFATLTPQSIPPPDHSLLDIFLAPTHLFLSLLLSNLLHDCLIALPLIFEK